MSAQMITKDTRYAVIAVIPYRTLVHVTRTRSPESSLPMFLWTIAFMGLEARLPIKSRSALPFFARIAVPRVSSARSPRVPLPHPCPSCFVTPAISRISPAGSCGGNASRRDDFRAFAGDTTDNLFVRKEQQQRTGLEGRGTFAPSCRRPPFDILRRAGTSNETAR